MRSPLATSTDAPTTRSCAITRWTIASRLAGLVACTPLAAEVSSKTRLKSIGMRMAGDYRHESCQLLLNKKQILTTDEHRWHGFKDQKALVSFLIRVVSDISVMCGEVLRLG